MLSDRVSNPGPLTYESGALPVALRGPAFGRKKIRLTIEEKYGTTFLSSDCNYTNLHARPFLSAAYPIMLLRQFAFAHSS